MSTIALYFSPQPTRAARAKWAFLEAGVQFEPHAIDVFAGEHKTESYLRKNPLGQVPTAIYDGQAVIESSALALIAALENPAAGLMPKLGTPGWRSVLQWVVFAPSQLEPILETLNQQRLFLPPKERSPALAKQATDSFARKAAFVTAALDSGPYLLGEAFSIADVCVGHSIVWGKIHDLLAANSRLQAYLDQLQTRPAFQEVYGSSVEVYPDPHAQDGT